jgi:hypothetical protein
VHVHADIFSASHKRVFLSGGVRAEHSKPYSKGGALFILRRVIGHLASQRLLMPQPPTR